MQIIKGLVLIVFQVRILPGVVLAGGLTGSEENGVIIGLPAQRPGVPVFIPLLDEKQTSLCAGVRLECVAVQPHNGQNPPVLCNEVPDNGVMLVLDFFLHLFKGGGKILFAEQ